MDRTALKIDELRVFVNETEKEPPPVFVGREDLLTDIEVKATTGWEKHGRGLAGNTIVVQGAPGAGKSSLLVELEKRNNGEGERTRRWRDGQRRVLRLAVNQVEAPRETFFELVRLVSPEEGETFLANKTTSWDIAAKIGLELVNVEGRKGGQTEPSIILTAFQRWLVSEKKRLRGPIIIAVDEAQNITLDKTLHGSRFLRDIHENISTLPLSLVLAGLGDTETRVNDAGVTRLDRVYSLGRFTRAESVDLMQRWCAHFGLAVGSQRPRLAMYCQLADDWPRHLHCAQKALGQAVLEHQGRHPDFDGRLDHLREPDWVQISARFARYRAEYYRGRQSGEMKDRKALTIDVMRSLTLDTTKEDVLGTIRCHLGDFDEPARSQQARAFRDHLVHQGALQENPDTDIVSCPIPSFRTWLVELDRPRQTMDSYSVRLGGTLFRSGRFRDLDTARCWALDLMDTLDDSRDVALWHGPLAVEILRAAAPDRTDGLHPQALPLAVAISARVDATCAVHRRDLVADIDDLLTAVDAEPAERVAAYADRVVAWEREIVRQRVTLEAKRELARTIVARPPAASSRVAFTRTCSCTRSGTIAVV